MKALGTNTGTTIVGYVLMVFGAIALKPELIDFLPEAVRMYVEGIATLIAFVAGGTFVQTVKGRNVTGGTVPANQEAQHRLEVDQEAVYEKPVRKAIVLKD